MTSKTQNKDSQVTGERGQFYFAPILTTFKKFFLLLGRLHKLCAGQAAMEYFILFSVILAATLLSVSTFYPRMHTVITGFYKKTAQGLMDSGVPATPSTRVSVTAFAQRGTYNPAGGPFNCGSEWDSAGGGTLSLPDEGYCDAGGNPPRHLDTQCWRQYESMVVNYSHVDGWNQIWGMNMPPILFPPHDICEPPSSCCPYVLRFTISTEQGTPVHQFALWLWRAAPCFLSGTSVTLADGSARKIEDIKVGDGVLSFDEKTQKKAISVVTKAFHHKTKEYLVVNGKIKVTGNHLFYSEGKWQEIGSLKVGGKLFDAGLKGVRINKIEKISAKAADVYNLEVDKYNNYFAEGFLAHNKP